MQSGPSCGGRERRAEASWSVSERADACSAALTSPVAAAATAPTKWVWPRSVAVHVVTVPSADSATVHTRTVASREPVSTCQGGGRPARFGVGGAWAGAFGCVRGRLYGNLAVGARSNRAHVLLVTGQHGAELVRLDLHRRASRRCSGPDGLRAPSDEPTLTLK